MATEWSAASYRAALGKCGRRKFPLPGAPSRVVAKLEVKAGDTIDFLVGCGGSDNSDSFAWTPVIRGDNGEWDARAQFAGPPPPLPPQLKPWEQFAQVLLETNHRFVSWIDSDVSCRRFSIALAEIPGDLGNVPVADR